MRTAARNEGGGPSPYGAGAHPYLRVGSGAIDDAILLVPAGIALEADVRGIPTGRRLPIVGSAVDFAAPRPIGSTALDTAYTALERDGAGIARVLLTTVDGAERVTVWMDAAYSCHGVYGRHP